MAIKMFLAGFLNADNVENDNATTAYSEDKYAIDLSGLLISQQDMLNIVEDIQNGDIDNITDLKEALDKAAALKEENERCLSANIANRLYGWQSLDHEDRLDFIDSCRQVPTALFPVVGVGCSSYSDIWHFMPVTAVVA